MYVIGRSRAVRRWRIQQKSLKRRVIRDASDPLAIDDNLFHKQYRVSKHLFSYLCSILEGKMTAAQRSTSIPTALKILSTLGVLGTGSFQTIIGQNRIVPLSQSSVSRCVDEVVNAMQHLLPRFVRFPSSQEERNRVKTGFHEKFKIPGVIGCIDGTLVNIAKPRCHPSEAAFLGPEGYAINASIICDSNLKIIGVCAQYGGAAHDSVVWKSWSLSEYIENIHNNGEAVWFLGDSGYPQRPWLMTPILNAADGSPEKHYTKMHIKTRACVEQCIGLLKARWRCLLRNHVLHYEPTKCAKIINACAVLHNLCINDNLLNENDIVVDSEVVEPFSGVIGTADITARQQLVDILWQSCKRSQGGAGEAGGAEDPP